MEQKMNIMRVGGSGSRLEDPPGGVARRDRIRALNDALRCQGEGGRVIISAGVAALSQFGCAAVLRAVARFAAFNADNDPYGEHDFGAVDIGGEIYFWKIDTYDLDLLGHSPDPADPAVTARVLTVMQAAEY
jgi:hypothetical protein